MSARKVSQIRCDFCEAHVEVELADTYTLYPEGWTRVDVQPEVSAEVNRFDLCPPHSGTVTVGQLWERIMEKRAKAMGMNVQPRPPPYRSKLKHGIEFK